MPLSICLSLCKIRSRPSLRAESAHAPHQRQPDKGICQQGQPKTGHCKPNTDGYGCKAASRYYSWRATRQLSDAAAKLNPAVEREMPERGQQSIEDGVNRGQISAIEVQRHASAAVLWFKRYAARTVIPLAGCCKIPGPTRRAQRRKHRIPIA